MNIQLDNTVRPSRTYECPICKDEKLIPYEKDGYSFVKYCECYEKERNLARINASGLSKQIEKCTFDSFIVTEGWQKRLKEIAISFLNQTEHWFFIGGQVGAGKSHLCTAISGELLKKYPLKFMLWRDEAVKLKACVNDGEEYYKLITPLKTSKALYIDDFLKAGKNSSPTAADLNIAFEVINYRYNNPDLITIISSEFSISQIIDFDEATGSRIHERAGKFCINVEKSNHKNYRLKQSI